MNHVFMAWLVQGQPRKKKRGIKVQECINKSTITAISHFQALGDIQFPQKMLQALLSTYI
jgi:hypothetical protein